MDGVPVEAEGSFALESEEDMLLEDDEMIEGDDILRKRHYRSHREDWDQEDQEDRDDDDDYDDDYDHRHRRFRHKHAFVDDPEVDTHRPQIDHYRADTHFVRPSPHYVPDEEDSKLINLEARRHAKDDDGDDDDDVSGAHGRGSSQKLGFFDRHPRLEFLRHPDPNGLFKRSDADLTAPKVVRRHAERL